MEKKRRYFVIKAATAQGMQRSFEHGFWAAPLRNTPPHPHEILNDAVDEGSQVILIGSVANSRRYQGYGEMTSKSEAVAVNNGDSADPQQQQAVSALSLLGAEDASLFTDKALSNPFRVKWITKYEDVYSGLEFQKTKELINSINGQTVNLSRNCQEIDATCGDELCRLIDEDWTQKGSPVAAVVNLTLIYRSPQRKKTSSTDSFKNRFERSQRGSSGDSIIIVR